jgi:DNA invertase Pin-like site-specific DNA recombinase
MGKFFLVVCGALAELERANILERQAEGIAIAKREGKYKGRKPLEIADFDKIYMSWKAGEITAVSACKLLGISRSTFYRKVDEREKNKT